MKKDNKINLDYIIKPESLLTKKQYNKVGKSEETSVHQKCNLEYRDFLPDDTELSIWGRLRKPEFQRPTFCWNAKKIVKLLKSVVCNRVIPGVILWLNTDTKHIFVLDGAHRLSVIRAWILDDWGDFEEKQERLFIGEWEKSDSQRIRNIVNKEIGSFEEYKKQAKRFISIVDKGNLPEEFMTSEELSRGKAMYSLNTALSIPIQWVIGDYKIAEKSFLDINTGGEGMIPQEVEFLKRRRSPVARAISGICGNGVNDKVWIGDEEKCTVLSKKLYSILLYRCKSANNELPFVNLEDKSGFEKFEFLLNIFTICKYGKTGQNFLDQTLVFMNDEEEDEDVKNETVHVLEDLDAKLSNITGKTSKSIGLYPDLYFYSSSGKYRVMLLLMFLAWFSCGDEKEISKRKLKFTENRELFENIWLRIRDYFYQGVNRSGVGPRRITTETVNKLDSLLDFIINNRKKNEDKICVEFISKVFPTILNKYKNEIGQYNIKSTTFNKSTKIKIELLTNIKNTYKCPICGGYIDINRSSQYDHIVQISKGGLGTPINGRIIHPWCNNNREILELEKVLVVNN